MRFGSNFNTKTYVRQAKRIGSPWHRFLAWRQGRADGRLELYGPPAFTEEFAQACQWWIKQQQRAATIQSQADKQVSEWLRKLENQTENHSRELEGANERIATLVAQSQGAHCKLPTTTYRSTAIFFALMFLFEFFFSAVSLITSGLVSIGFELAIAIVAAGALVWLSEIVGTHLRQLPLSSGAGSIDHTRHYGEIVLSSLALAGILAGINFLRSLANPNASALPASGLAVSGLVDTTHQVVQWALLAIGIGLVLTGVFRAGDHEYSGPRYGLAGLERRRNKALRGLSFCDSTTKRLKDFHVQLENLLGSNLNKVFATYADQYKRQSMGQRRVLSRG